MSNETILINALRLAVKEMEHISLIDPYFKEYQDCAKNFLYSEEYSAIQHLIKIKPEFEPPVLKIVPPSMGMPPPPGM